MADSKLGSDRPGRPDLRAVLAKPLITGASVSADQSSLSPGKKLSQRYCPGGDIRTIAEGGKRGVEVLRRLSLQDFKDRSIVIAVDLFFWDSAAAHAGEALSSLATLVARVKENNIPLVLGEIPELLPGHQPSRARLNDAIAGVRESYPLCAVMPFDQIFKSVLRNGFLEIRGRRHGLFELVPDGLHLADFAGDYLSGVLEAELLKTLCGP